MSRRSVVVIAYRSIRKAVADGIGDLAATIAYYVFFGIFPFLIAVLSWASLIMDSQEVQEAFSRYIDTALPSSAAFIEEQLGSLMRARGPMSIAGVIALLWSASSAFGAITRAFNRALGTTRAKPYLLARLDYMLMAIVASTLMAIAVTISCSVELLFASDKRLILAIGLEVEQITRVLAWLATYGLTVLVFGLIYKGAPYEKSPWRFVWPGALLAAACNELAKFGFIFYLGHTTRMELIFGSLTSIMILLMWLYITAIGLIAGFEFNVVLRREREGAA